MKRIAELIEVVQNIMSKNCDINISTMCRLYRDNEGFITHYELKETYNPDMYESEVEKQLGKKWYEWNKDNVRRYVTMYNECLQVYRQHAYSKELKQLTELGFNVSNVLSFTKGRERIKQKENVRTG